MTVRNDSQNVVNYRREIKRYMVDQQQLLRSLKNSHAKVGSVWKDPLHLRFGDFLNGLSENILHQMPDFEDYCKKLNKLAENLERIERLRV